MHTYRRYRWYRILRCDVVTAPVQTVRHHTLSSLSLLPPTLPPLSPFPLRQGALFSLSGLLAVACYPCPCSLLAISLPLFTYTSSSSPLLLSHFSRCSCSTFHATPLPLPTSQAKTHDSTAFILCVTIPFVCWQTCEAC
eukprot:2470251-Pleurochrysis_carterae.AAC.1